jgi:hypothetical protein
VAAEGVVQSSGIDARVSPTSSLEVVAGGEAQRSTALTRRSTHGSPGRFFKNSVIVKVSESSSGKSVHG